MLTTTRAVTAIMLLGVPHIRLLCTMTIAHGNGLALVLVDMGSAGIFFHLRYVALSSICLAEQLVATVIVWLLT